MIEDTRVALLRESMVRRNVEICVIGPTSNLVWLTGLIPHGDERPVLLFVGRRRCGMLIPEVNAASQRSATAVPFYTWSDGDGPRAALCALISDVSEPGPDRTVALDEAMRTSFALVLDELPSFAKLSLSDLISPLRLCKDETEYDKLRASAPSMMVPWRRPSKACDLVSRSWRLPNKLLPSSEEMVLIRGLSPFASATMLPIRIIPRAKESSTRMIRC